MKKLLLILGISLIVLPSMTSCLNNSSTANVPSVQDIVETDNQISYKAYTTFLDDFTNNIVIEGFTLTPPLKTIFLIDRDLTFNKKDTITLEGGKNDFNPTQQLFIFENSDKSVQLYVRIAYTNVEMGNQLVSWEVPSGHEGVDQELVNKTDMATYTYRNLIITVTQNSKTQAELDLTKEAVRSVLVILEKYYSGNK
ncbi:hypothetical protein DNH61_07025 [Paenibacillus sambharensis]|uniref:Lipoprotein n=1 Tax=Paenibacillus sambharensis TaxID=1803190 RepID=A0A2W1L8P3_9BACL|nr:hypothetical protein [Paenibacillus sambharensis]PZD96548.1 hypothetical protein DNH61_07025 [Paenibacillus sambharensis]